MYARDSKCMCVFRGIVSYKMMQKGVPKITSILLSKQELYHCSRISQEYEPKLSFASPVAAYSIRYWSCSVRLNTFDNKLFTICQVDFYHVRTHAVSNISLCCATHLTIVNKAQKTFLLVEKSPMYQRIFQDSNIILYMWISVRYYPMPKPFHATHTHIRTFWPYIPSIRWQACAYENEKILLSIISPRMNNFPLYLRAPASKCVSVSVCNTLWCCL